MVVRVRSTLTTAPRAARSAFAESLALTSTAGFETTAVGHTQAIVYAHGSAATLFIAGGICSPLRASEQPVLARADEMLTMCHPRYAPRSARWSFHPKISDIIQVIVETGSAMRSLLRYRRQGQNRCAGSVESQRWQRPYK